MLHVGQHGDRRGSGWRTEGSIRWVWILWRSGICFKFIEWLCINEQGYCAWELTSRGAEMDVGSSISYWSICHLQWAVGPLGKRLSHLHLFKDTCFVSGWAFSICGWLSLSWLNPEWLFHVRVLNNWTHIDRYSPKPAVDPCSSLSGTNAQTCGAYFIQMTPLWRPVQWRADSVSHCFALATAISVLRALAQDLLWKGEASCLHLFNDSHQSQAQSTSS